MKTREEKIKELAHDLIGSSGMSDLETYMEDEGEIQDITLDEFKMIDEIVFKCTCCDWWCGEDEKETNENDEWVCRECHGDNAEE
jgi:hypothetical protein